MDSLKKWRRNISSFFRKPSSAPSLILMYHRVDEDGIDPWGLNVTPQHFAEHLSIIKKHAQPLSLVELESAWRAGKIPERGVVVTFDDGYANNLFNAKPLLSKNQVPATVFVATGYISNQREFWWDELEQIFLTPGSLPKKLELTVSGNNFEYDLDESATYTRDQWIQDYGNSIFGASYNSRMALYYKVWKSLQPLDELQRVKMLDHLIEWSGEQPQLRDTHRAMTPEELMEIEEGGLIQIGAHTVHHPLLSTQAPETQKQEIEQSKAALEQVLGHEVTTFAYPFGNYSRQTTKLVDTAGFACACSTVEGTISVTSDSYQFPRFMVYDWDRSEFEYRLLNWLNNA